MAELSEIFTPCAIAWYRAVMGYASSRGVAIEDSNDYFYFEQEAFWRITYNRIWMEYQGKRLFNAWRGIPAMHDPNVGDDVLEGLGREYIKGKFPKSSDTVLEPHARLESKEVYLYLNPRLEVEE